MLSYMYTKYLYYKYVLCYNIQEYGILRCAIPFVRLNYTVR